MQGGAREPGDGEWFCVEAGDEVVQLAQRGVEWLQYRGDRTEGVGNVAFLAFQLMVKRQCVAD